MGRRKLKTHMYLNKIYKSVNITQINKELPILGHILPFWEQRHGNAGTRTRSKLPAALIIIAFVSVHSFWFCV